MVPFKTWLDCGNLLLCYVCFHDSNFSPNIKLKPSLQMQIPQLHFMSSPPAEYLWLRRGIDLKVVICQRDVDVNLTSLHH